MNGLYSLLSIFTHSEGNSNNNEPCYSTIYNVTVLRNTGSIEIWICNPIYLYLQMVYISKACMWLLIIRNSGQPLVNR